MSRKAEKLGEIRQGILELQKQLDEVQQLKQICDTLKQARENLPNMKYD
jgi:23S rRNA A2030 N6-methylase RlmJ